MGYEKERAEFVAMMVAEGMDERIAILIMRDANTVQRYAAEACNRELSEREIRLEKLAHQRIVSRLSRCCRPQYAGDTTRHNRMPWSVKFSGDPRGYCVKIKVPSGRTTDFGAEGIGVPTRRF